VAQKTTLQYRIVLLTVIFSVCLIAAFTMLQLRNKMNSLNELNKFRARLGAFLVRNIFQNSLETLNGIGYDDGKSLIESTLETYLASQVIENVTVITPVTSISIKDREKVTQIRASETGEWLFPFVDKRNIEMFISFLPATEYIIKVSYYLGDVQEAFKEVYRPVILTVVIVLIANVIFAAILSRTIVNPVRILHKFTRTIAAGNLESKVTLHTEDELEALGESFNYMADELKKMKAIAENANPLTKLPGNIVIMEEVDKRIKQGKHFVVFYTDLDNFKAFNDKYGIHQGDEAIKMTADIMKGVVKEKGNKDDLVGHEGGDDFVIVTTPDRGEIIGKTIVETFDAKVKDLYDPKDLEQGFFMSKDRSGAVRKFPIMGVSLAGVTNQSREIASYGEVTNICADIKKKVKAVEGSAYWIDHRTGGSR